MKIGLDVMGGDYAPQATIAGAVLAQKEISADDVIVLFGDKDIIEAELRALGANPEDYQIEHCSEVIGMAESPTKAIVQKPNSSIVRGFEMLKSREIDGFSSAGNTGAMLVGAMYSIKTIPGITRPCTIAVLPKEKGGIGILLDVGTNPDVKPDLLYEFAVVGNVYAKYVYGIENPKVGLLNIGEEEEKGNLLCQSAFKLMKDSADFNFIGNVEGRDLFNDQADVIVCDGFIGNIVLKQTEAMYKLIMKHGLAKDEFFGRLNYENYGGTPIMGVNGTVLIGHGISNDKAIKNLILMTKEVEVADITGKIKKAINKE